MLNADVPLLRTAALTAIDGVAHGFTTREGGVSTGSLASLNLALRQGEEPDHLVANWDRVVRALDGDGVVLLDQVHGADVVVVDEATGPLATAAAADGVVTTQPGLVLAVRTADCVPVLFAARGGVAAAHAGWRGTAAGVVAATVRALRDATGSNEVVAAIGPHIGAYEVGEEVVSGLEASGVDRADFITGTGAHGNPCVSLLTVLRAQLDALDVRVEATGGDTLTDPRFFSHRRDPSTGRQAGVISLRRTS